MIAAALFLTLLLAGACAPPSPSAVTLRVLHWAGDYEVTAEQRIADVFAARHPGVTVLVESVVTNYDEKLLTSIAAGAPPDVFLLDGPDIPTYLDRGLALDLTPYLPHLGYDPSRVQPAVMRAFQRGGRTYALPKDYTPMALYLNLDVFERLGVAPPGPHGWTWRAFQSAARRLTRDLDGDGRTDVYALDFPRNLYQWIPWVWSAGADILDPSGTRATGYLDAPSTLDVFRFLTGLVTRDSVTPGVQYLESGDPAREARFATGGQAMLLSGHWTLQLLRGLAENRLHLAVAPIPHRDGMPTVTVLYASGWAVPPNAPHRKLSVELAAFLASEEAQRMRAMTHLAIPVFRDVAEQLAREDTTGIEQTFLELAGAGRMTWGARVRDFYEVEEATFQVMDRHLLRGEPLEESAERAAADIDRVLGR